MKTTSKIAVLLIGVKLLLSACSVDGFEQNTTTLTDEESMIASQIIGESVSENQNGLLSSFSEAFAIPTTTGLVDGPSDLVTGSFRNLENYSYSFNPETGEHTATFAKRAATNLLRSETRYMLIFIFFDINGGKIEFPKDHRSQIDALDFRAVRNGEIDASSKRSIFTRTDRLFIDGISDVADILSIDGFHFGKGLFTQIRNDGTQLEREYLLDLNFLDIRIDKPLVLRNRNFRSGVHGAFSYEKTIRQTGNANGGQGTKIINGTVELNDDGTALLKYREQFDTFRLRLADGVVFEDDEFEGRVVKVDLEEQIFTISNGQRIQITDQTEIEIEEFSTLEEVALAVGNGVRVIAMGDYFHPEASENLWIAIEVEFELESNEFEDIVASVNLADNSLTLVNGDTFFITDRSEIEFEDELNSLQDVAEAVEAGMPVVAEGEFYIDTGSGNLIVKEIEFVLEFNEFDEHITSVNTTENTFTLESGKIVLITENTVIDDDGDFITLEQVADALSEGIEVEANGKFYYDPIREFWISVIVEFLE